jgi:hypothetical protein
MDMPDKAAGLTELLPRRWSQWSGVALAALVWLEYQMLDVLCWFEYPSSGHLSLSYERTQNRILCSGTSAGSRLGHCRTLFFYQKLLICR